MTTKKHKILIVEDNIELSDLYRERLDLEGFEVLIVDNGEKALATALEYLPDLILLDIMMPAINGFDVLDILKTTEKTKNTKVIMLTALSQAQDKTKAAERNADDYLVKSEASLDDILTCIRKHLA